MRSHGNVWFAVGTALVVGAVVAAYFLVLGGEREQVAPSAQPPPPSMPTAVGARLSRAEGKVELRPPSGDWRQAVAGASVGAGTDVRTQAGGSAALTYGEDVEIALGAESSARLENLDGEVARVRVGKGLVTADVQPGSGRTVRIAVENSDAVAETRDGRVHVLSDGGGRVQTAVTRGTATLRAHGRSVELPAGTQSTVEPGAAPQAPTAVPASLLLRIKWPPAGTTPKRRQVVTGVTNPGARVRVGSTVLMADSAGRFRAVVELTEGRNELSAEVVDVLGRSKSARSPAIELDTRAPAHAVQTGPGMWKRKSR